MDVRKDEGRRNVTVVCNRADLQVCSSVEEGLIRVVMGEVTLLIQEEDLVGKNIFLSGDGGLVELSFQLES